jgi:hypothetical protein
MKIKTYKGITFRAERIKPYQAYLSISNRNGTFQKVIGQYRTLKEAVQDRESFIDNLK